MKSCNGLLVICLVCLSAAKSTAAPPEVRSSVSELSLLSTDALPPEKDRSRELLREWNALRIAQRIKEAGAFGSSSAPSKFTRRSAGSDPSQSTAEERKNKKLVRKVRSKAIPFAYTISTNQTVLVKILRTKETRLVGEYWPTDESKADEKERIARMVDHQIHNRLRGRGFNTVPYQDALDEGVNMKNALVIEGDIGIITKGIDHPLITATIRVYAADDPKRVYSTFVDGGMLGQVTGRIRTRFVMSLH